MTLSIPSDLEAKVKQQASRAGLSVEGWLRQVLEREIKATAPLSSLQDELTPEEWVRQFRAWSESHDRTTPLLSDEAISRENIYPDRI
jgi:hypothetical protein